MWVLLLFLVPVFLLFALRARGSRRRYNLPPGPPSFPLIGSLPHMLWAGASKPAFAFKRLGDKYGHIFSLRAGFVPMVVLNEYEAMMELGSAEEVLNRIDATDDWILAKSRGAQVGVFFSCEARWVETRAFCHKTLRKYGFTSKSALEGLVMSEMKAFCDDWKKSVKTSGGLIQINKQFSLVFFNVVWTLLSGRRCGWEEPFLKSLIKVTLSFTKYGKLGGGIQFFYPNIIHYFPYLTGYTQLKKNSEDWIRLLEGVIAEHRTRDTYKISPQSFIDEYLCMIDQEGNKANPLESIYTDLNLVAVLQDFLLGGVDTESHLMKYLLKVFIAYPDVQRKVREEVDGVVGRNRPPTVADIPELIYTQATFFELLRVEIPATVTMRKVTKDYKIRNYDIPKGTSVICNLWTANFEERNWKDPKTFNPQRFINASGELFNTERIMSFGFGKRRCVGEPVAKVNMVLAVATLVQEFEFEVDAASGIPPDDADIHGFTRDIPPFNVRIKIRD